jgi:hypothetical protein
MKNIACCLLILGLLLGVTSCKKNLFDYRNKYVGNYHFVYTTSSWMLGTPSLPPVTTEYDGRIYYNRSDADSVLRFEFKSGFERTLFVSKDGTLKECGGTGTFSSKSSFNYKWISNACDYAMGGGATIEIVGNAR